MTAMISSRDRLETILARLAARSGAERVFLRLYPEVARAAADAADRRRQIGMSLGPLDGVIVSIKDLFDVAGEPTLAGSVLRRPAATALRDAVIVARLRQAGAVIVGKTNMTEFAFTAIGVNPHYGTPGNAADASRVPGGSSSGAGVSVGEGTSEISIGSDTGGSVRIPAALNGVVGFKPTARRVPLDGAFALSPTLDSVGPLARSVADCAIADAVMAGEEPVALAPLRLAGLRFGIARGRLFENIEDDVAQAFERSIQALAGAGALIADFCIDDLLAAMRDATRGGSIAAIEGAEIHADWLGTDAAASVDPRVGGPLSRALTVPAATYIRTMRRRRILAAAMDERLSGVDALVLPTTPITAPATAPLLADGVAGNRVESLLLRNTQVANQFDLCAVSLPMAMPGSLPAGLMLVARNGHDQRLFGVAAAVERLVKEA